MQSHFKKLNKYYQLWKYQVCLQPRAIAPRPIAPASCSVEDEADAIMCPNEAVLEDYKARQRECESIEAGLVEQERSLGASAAEIDALRAEWTPKLRRLVETINENFKRNFAAIAENFLCPGRCIRIITDHISFRIARRHIGKGLIFAITRMLKPRFRGRAIIGKAEAAKPARRA